MLLMPTPRLRLVRLVPDPLGMYIRAGHTDQKDLQNFITAGSRPFTGVVFEAKRPELLMGTDQLNFKGLS